MRNEESEFSSLKTVSSFDRGDSCTVAVNSQNTHFSPTSLLVESLIEQLCKLMEKDPHDQKKLYMRKIIDPVLIEISYIKTIAICEKLHQMNLISKSYEREEFEVMRSHYQKALYRLLALAKNTTLENQAICPRTSCQINISNGSILECSRYCTEFQELEYIARGGFGLVFKAKHKLDGEIYAIKKILLRYGSVNNFLQNLKEVKMLAKLNHPNIVSYKAAWLEELEEKTKTKQSKIQEVPALLNADLAVNQEDEDSSIDVIFEGPETSMSVKDESVSMSCTSGSSALLPANGVICKKVYQFSYRESSFSISNQRAALFIQMQLCERTMRHWLDQRNQTLPSLGKSVDKYVEIFKKVVKGVEYIHSQGIVHHDIKPSNIFVNGDLTEVQVGDFGLACLIHPPSSLSVISTHSHGGIGTRLYAAPEQLEGTCHPKSDVYSLGIVLFELLEPFNTVMERTKVIEQLRSGLVPTKLNDRYPHLAKVISETITSLRLRPTSSELLKNLEEQHTADTAKVVAEQNELIQQLRKESLAKDEEIAFLKKKLEEVLGKGNGLSLS